MPIMIGAVSEILPITAMMIADSRALWKVSLSKSLIDPFSSIDVDCISGGVRFTYWVRIVNNRQWITTSNFFISLEIFVFHGRCSNSNDGGDFSPLFSCIPVVFRGCQHASARNAQLCAPRRGIRRWYTLKNFHAEQLFLIFLLFLLFSIYFILLIFIYF